MIRVIKASGLYKRPLLAAAMFRDRAGQFIERHGWDLTIDERGLEFDQYDDLNPTYVIIEDEYGDHLASARVMPTTGRTMINEHFLDLVGGTPIESATIWEITRFCASPRIETLEGMTRISLWLMWAVTDLAHRSGVEAYVGCCASPFTRLMKGAGVETEILGQRGAIKQRIIGGKWAVSGENLARLAKKTGTINNEVFTFHGDNNEVQVLQPFLNSNHADMRMM